MLPTWNARLSPNGTRLSVAMIGDGPPDVWVSDVDQNTLTRVTTGDSAEFMGVWLPDSPNFVFTSTRDGGRSFYSTTVDGTGDVRRLATVDKARGLVIWGRPVNAEQIVFAYETGEGFDVARLSLDGSSAIEPVLDTEANERFATVSPDGRWLAYESDESGGWEIYVQRYPELGQRQRLSTAGGRKPLWHPDGEGLFYLRRNAMMFVPMAEGAALSPGGAVMMFETSESLEGDLGGNTGVQGISPDGERFLALLPPSQPEEPTIAVPGFVIVLNWLAELEARMSDGSFP